MSTKLKLRTSDSAPESSMTPIFMFAYFEGTRQLLPTRIVTKIFVACTSTKKPQTASCFDAEIFKLLFADSKVLDINDMVHK